MQLDAALNAKLESTGQTVPELKRFLERALATLERAQTPQAARCAGDGRR